jgi:hypothetical protein
MRQDTYDESAPPLSPSSRLDIPRGRSRTSSARGAFNITLIEFLFISVATSLSYACQHSDMTMGRMPLIERRCAHRYGANRSRVALKTMPAELS